MVLMQEHNLLIRSKQSQHH